MIGWEGDEVCESRANIRMIVIHMGRDPVLGDH